MRFLFLLLFPGILLSASWAESTLASMTLEEKIGQLFMAPICPLRKKDHWEDWMVLMKEFHIGNGILKHSDPITQIEFLKRLQKESKIPLLISADAEWGLAMRMSNTIAFPRNMTLGAIADIFLIEQMGQEIGREAKFVGIHMSLAPVADVNNNPLNPIIHTRSFGENPREVGARASAYFRGLESAGILACAKHFPGHGDTSMDSHKNLPAIPFSKERLDAVEFVPFRKVIQEGISAIMSAHLLVPVVDPVYPSSLSSACLRAILRDELHFEGLIVTDALNMKALTDHFSYEEIAVLAKGAGSDILLYGDHLDSVVDELLQIQIPKAFKALREAYLSGALKMSDLDQSVLRVLRAKEKLKLNERSLEPSENVLEELHSKEAISLKKTLYREAVTLVGAPLLPLMTKVAYFSIGEGDAIGKEFSSVFQAPLTMNSEIRKSLEQKFSPFDQILIALHQVDFKAPHFGLSEDLRELIHSLSSKSILCHFATPYALKEFKEQKTILVGYENDPDAQLAVLHVLQGKEKARGHLPVTP
ncbi:MAG: glycoside hydrolase family 3 N-terminal domain-containing protein [Chlamydiota bacterium]